MAHRRLLGVLLCLTLLMVTGCWDRREPEMLAFVIAVGLDQDPVSGEYKIVAQIYNPLAMTQEMGGKGSPKKPAVVMEATGRTPYEARQNLAPKSSKELFWAHTGILLLGEDLAQMGIRPVLDLFERERQLRLIARPLVVEGDIKDILTAEFPLEETSGQALLREIQTSQLTSSILPVLETRELINILSQPGHELLIPRVKGSTEDRDKKEGSVADTLPPIYLAGGAAFCGDCMAGWLDAREVRGWHWIQQKARRAVLVVASPVDEKPVSVEIFRAHSSVKPEIDGDKVTMRIKVDVQGRIQDQISGADMVLKQDVLSSLERRTATIIKNDIMLAVRRAQDLKSDIFGFGNAVYR
ncbi:MAG: Ger(x)C family spore germination protein, partial [Firmicutes bacterium]|nr:Ger(x)C family spore germination protein [Bacillota bacterium]